jgi:hypothetical protein
VRPDRPDIAVPELTGRIAWLNSDGELRMADLCARGPVLVHFFDFAQLNSVRALPYPVAWDERYREAGLTTLGVHTPRFPFTAEADAVRGAIERLGVRHPVAVDSNYALWNDYGCRGWPSLFLWGADRALKWAHFGEGEYAATEDAIQAELRAQNALAALPEPLAPLRATDAPGALVAPPSEELFPGGSASEPWTGRMGAITLEYAAGGAHASVAGAGEVRVTLDGARIRSLPVTEPGLIDLALHPRHERHALEIDADAALEIYSISFSPGTP